MSGRRRRFQRALRRHRQRARRPAAMVVNYQPSLSLVPPCLEATADRIVRVGGKILFAPSECMGPCYDAQNFFDPDLDRGKWAGDHTTSVAPSPASFRESWQRVAEAIRSLKEKIVPPPPTAEFFYVHGSKDVAVLVNGEPAGVLTAEQFEELKAKLKEPPVGG